MIRLIASFHTQSHACVHLMDIALQNPQHPFGIPLVLRFSHHHSPKRNPDGNYDKVDKRGKVIYNSQLEFSLEANAFRMDSSQTISSGGFFPIFSSGQMRGVY